MDCLRSKCDDLYRMFIQNVYVMYCRSKCSVTHRYNNNTMIISSRNSKGSKPNCVCEIFERKECSRLSVHLILERKTSGPERASVDHPASCQPFNSL